MLMLFTTNKIFDIWHLNATNKLIYSHPFCNLVFAVAGPIWLKMLLLCLLTNNIWAYLRLHYYYVHVRGAMFISVFITCTWSCKPYYRHHIYHSKIAKTIFRPILPHLERLNGTACSAIKRPFVNWWKAIKSAPVSPLPHLPLTSVSVINVCSQGAPSIGPLTHRPVTGYMNLKLPKQLQWSIKHPCISSLWCTIKWKVSYTILAHKALHVV